MWALAMYPINYQVILTLLCGWCRECYNHGLLTMIDTYAKPFDIMLDLTITTLNTK